MAKKPIKKKRGLKRTGARQQKLQQARRKKRAGKNKRKAGADGLALISRMAGFVWRGGLIFVGLSFFWVVLYGFLPVKSTSLMGVRHLQGASIERQWQPLEEISPNLMRAVIAAEDNKFCSHIGFDFGEMKAAFEDAMAGSGWRGASTISQQTAKNAFLWPGRDIVRKGLEAWFTLLEEAIWPKRRVMEVYLNVAEWGPGIFGADAAAHYWFRKPAKDLNAYEASLLAAILPNPRKWSANPPGPYVANRAAHLRKRMSKVRLEGMDQCLR